MARVMGVLNVTPDSFSDGGRWLDPAAAIAHGRQMIAEGADMIDVGGESTRPGASPVDADEEMRRVLPVIEALAGEVEISVDTRKEPVARSAVAAGATVINDVSSSLWPVAADTGAGWVAMHMRGEPSDMQRRAVYSDVVTEVRDHLLDRAERAARAGVERIWIDPGIGFAKNAHHNLSLLKHLSVLVDSGWPVLVGTSRKSFLGRVAAPGTDPLPALQRLEGTVATTAWAITQGAAMVRVHDVRPAVMASRLAAGRATRSGAHPMEVAG
ncbi:MAG TPA: dihydropteroate synthase [Acidimicrobiales bacterium]|nr:dihydropteroate synthase [Acidimicrobiales bacterium]